MKPVQETGFGLAALVCLSSPVGAQPPQICASVPLIEASASDDACARLISLTQRSCSAKVNCSAAAAVADEAFEAYQVCLSGGTLAQSALNDLIDRAGGEMEFVCCIATGLPHRADSR